MQSTGLFAQTTTGAFPTIEFFIAFSVALAIAIFLLQRSKKRESYIPNIPEVPNRHWLFGHLFYPPGGDQLAKQKAWCIDSADPKSGLCTFYMFRSPTLSVTKPEHAQKILRTNTHKMSLPIFKRMSERTFGKNNVANINGRMWKIHRTPVTRAMQSERALRAAQPHILRVGNTLADSIVRRRRQANEAADDSHEVVAVGSAGLNIVPVMKMATIDVFGAAALGRDLGCCESLQPCEVANAFDFLGADFMRRMRSPLSPSSHIFWIPTKTNRRAIREHHILRDFLRETIESHMRTERETDKEAEDTTEEERSHNLLSEMLAINSTFDVNDEAYLDVEAMIDSMIVLLFAGYDTTANALSFALYEVAKNSLVQERCVGEAREVLQELQEEEEKMRRRHGQQSSRSKKEDEETIDVLSRLPYCHAVLQEALRLYPPLSSTVRTIEKDLKLDDVVVPKGTTVIIPIFHMHRDEKNFPRPTEFLPERWVVKGNDEQRWVERFEKYANPAGECEDANHSTTTTTPVANRDAYLPFSSGARNCAGRRFALQEGTLLLAVLLTRLKFELEPGYEMKPGHSGPILEPKGGLPLVINERE